MSSENRPGNVHANQCERHGDFIGPSCPVCDGIQRRVNTMPSKLGYRLAKEAGLEDEDDD